MTDIILSERRGVTDREQAEEVFGRYSLENVIARYAADYDVPTDMARRVVEELKRFLGLCAIHPNARYGMRGIVDDAWHTFMIFSRDYSAFCQDLAGEYIHHEPEEHGDPDVDPTTRLKTSRDSYLRTLADYEETFGEPASAEIWPRIVVGDSIDGPSCRNACGRSCSRCGRGCSACGHGCRGCNRCSH